MKGTLTKTTYKHGWLKGGEWQPPVTVPVLVPAILSNGLGLHFKLDGGGLSCLYVISHCGSGLAIARFHDRLRALEALKALAPLYSWDSLTPSTLPSGIRLRVELAIGHLLDAEAIEELEAA